MQKTPLTHVIFPVATAILVAQPALSVGTKVMTTAEARGVGGHVAPLTIWLGPALNINFAPSGETVEKVWLDDISRIGLDTDSPLCDPQSPCQGESEASIVHLKRRSDAITFPGNSQTSTTLVSIVTRGADGRKHLNQFMLLYGSGKPEYTSVTIAPTPRPQLIAQPVAAPKLDATPVLPPPSEKPATKTRILSRHETHIAFTGALVPDKKPALNFPAPSSRPAESLEAELHHIQTGVDRAKKQGLISRKRGNAYLASEVARYISYRKGGSSPKEAAHRAGLPLYVLQTFENMGD